MATSDEFKTYVHKRLDDAGIPIDPHHSPHKAKGCRIGGRLDLVLSVVAAAKALQSATAGEIDDQESDVWIVMNKALAALDTK